MAKEYLYEVGIRPKNGGETIDLRVWSEDAVSAGSWIVCRLCGAYGEYEWRGTGPVYENNQIVTRER